MKTETRKSLIDYIWGLVTGAGAAVLFMYLISPSLAVQKSIKYAAYQYCMANAGELRCHMTPGTMIEYFQIKEELGL